MKGILLFCIGCKETSWILQDKIFTDELKDIEAEGYVIQTDLDKYVNIFCLCPSCSGRYGEETKQC